MLGQIQSFPQLENAFGTEPPFLVTLRAAFGLGFAVPQEVDYQCILDFGAGL